ncbi:MAG: ketoacyl-ACP synthase III [Candidatus Obscuribacterales bacterium]|nr:ketoacyl-ACP synthase III [Candidatus Obscuribacterales bacterium]
MSRDEVSVVSIAPKHELITGKMGKLSRAKISAIDIAVPPKLLTNADLEKLVATTDQWIMERTGIRQRHIVEPGVTSSDLGAEAALKILAKTGVAATDIDLIIFSTISPDMFLPATACLVQNKIGATKAWGFDLSAACSGFLYGLQVGAQFIATGAHKNVLVIGIDVMSGIIDYTDRATCVIFGDGGGAALLQPAGEGEDAGFIDFLFEVDGSGGDALCIPAGGSKTPATHETVDKRLHYVHQDGHAVFKMATRKMAEICSRLLERNGLTGQDVDLFVPHQANKRIIDSAAERLGMPSERIIINIDEYGNTTAGTLPLALNSARDKGMLKKGDLVLFATVGAGFSAGAALVRWGY